MEEFRAVVSGRVQMVTYRAFVEKHAHNLSVTGYVRNMMNGDVEVVAQGSAESLRKLLEHMHKGPFFAKVTSIEIEWRTPAETYAGFEVRY